MKLFVVDTETTDLEPEKGATILELAWMTLELKDGWKPTSCCTNYIEYSGPVNPKALASHHIRADQTTKEYGAIPRENAINWLQKHLEEDSIVVAHNSAFDSKFLPEITRPWICTLKSARHIWPEAPGHSNQVLRYWLKIDPCCEPILSIAPIVAHMQPHQALFDVATTACILSIMLKKGYTTDQLLHLSRTPVTMKKINIGQYKGMDFDKVPRDYLIWLRKQSNLNEDLKHTIDTILAA